LIVAPSVACYLYYSHTSYHKIKGLLKKIIAVGILLTEQPSYIDCHCVTMFRNILTPFSTGLWR